MEERQNTGRKGGKGGKGARRKGGRQGGGGGGSAAAVGSGNANFLLNFKYEVPAVRVENYSRSRDYAEAYADRYGSGGGKRAGGAVRGHRQRQMEKDRFLHANFRFVLEPGASLEVLQDPERGVRWPEIGHIVYSTAAAYRCPICLEEPTAPRMTKCGHIYCWTCLLHYARAVSMTPSTPLDRPSVSSLCLGELEVDEKVKKCPICLQMFALQEVRSVEIVRQREHTPSKWVELLLLQCAKGHSLPAPADQWKTQEVAYASLPEYGSPGAVYARFNAAPAPACKGSVLRTVIEREEKQLRRSMAAALDDEKAWLDLALVQVQVIRLSLDAIRQEHEEVTAIAAQEAAEAAREAVTETVRTVESEVEAKEREGDVETDAAGSSEVIETMLYYQLVDGQRAYLHPLCQRALMNEYGSFEKMPQRIIARLLEKEEHSVTRAARKRFKFLSHVPLSSAFLLYELDMSPFVGSEALLPLQEKLRQRQKQREKVVAVKKQEARKQRLKERKIQQKLRKAKQDLAPQSYPPISSEAAAAAAATPADGMSDTYRELLAYEESLVLARQNGHDVKAEAWEEDSPLGSSPQAAPTWVSNSSTQVLAAQIKARQHVPLSMAAPAPASASAFGSPPMQGLTVRSGIDSDDEDVELLAPDYKNLFMSDLRESQELQQQQQQIQQQQQQQQSAEPSVAEAEASPGGRKRKKGRKGKKGTAVVLFGNSSHRNYRS